MKLAVGKDFIGCRFPAEENLKSILRAYNATALLNLINLRNLTYSGL